MEQQCDYKQARTIRSAKVERWPSLHAIISSLKALFCSLLSNPDLHPRAIAARSIFLLIPSMRKLLPWVSLDELRAIKTASATRSLKLSADANLSAACIARSWRKRARAASSPKRQGFFGRLSSCSRTASLLSFHATRARAAPSSLSSARFSDRDMKPRCAKSSTSGLSPSGTLASGRRYCARKRIALLLFPPIILTHANEAASARLSGG